jgi:magnesium chelatase subunit I
VLHEVAERLGVSPADPPGRIAAAVELALEALYLSRRLAKDADDGTAVYGP